MYVSQTKIYLLWMILIDRSFPSGSTSIIFDKNDEISTIECFRYNR